MRINIIYISFPSLRIIKSVFRFIKFYFRAATRYQVHSPFVFEFILRVLDLKKPEDQNNPGLKKLRSGSWKKKTIVRIVNFYSPKTFLEIACSDKLSAFYPINNDSNPLIIAETLEEVKNKTEGIKTLDFVRLGSDTQKINLLDVLNLCLSKAHDKTVFVFDEIHSIKDREEVWGQIKSHPKVTVTLDLFHLGVVFIRSQQKQKEHFILTPLRWKPFMFFSLGGPKN